MKSIVIFGGAGFVGRHLIRRLAKKGHKIIVPYQKSIQEAKIRLLGVTGQITPFRFSSIDDLRLKSVLQKSQICINLKTTYDQKNGSFEDKIFIKFFGFLEISIFIKWQISSPFDICTKHNLSLFGFNPIVSLSKAIILEALKLAGRSPL